MRVAHSRRSGRASHWKATPSPTESPARMLWRPSTYDDAAVAAVWRLWESWNLHGMRDLHRETLRLQSLFAGR
jgi:hypothetical protein